MNTSQQIHPVHRKFLPLSKKGFTLLELLLVLFAVLLLNQFTLYTFPKTSRTEQIELELQKLIDTLYLSQQYALTHEQLVVITFYKESGKYYSEDAKTKEVIANYDTKQLLKYMGPESILYIQITGRGTFSRSNSYYFKTDEGVYRLVILIGQGRFYYEKL